MISIDKQQVKTSFASASQTYDALAHLQRQIGLDMLTQFELNIAEKTVLDVGCGTGFLTQQLLAHRSTIKHMIAVDIAFAMLQATQAKLVDIDINYICADAEHLPLSHQSMDQIVSNVALQWCQNLSVVFADFKRILKPQGQLTFSTFGDGTLHELKHAWQAVDHYAHVNDFYSPAKLAHFLQQAGFQAIQIETKQYQCHYHNVFALMRELKGIGAHNVLTQRNRQTTTKGQMQHMLSAYPSTLNSTMITATYEVIFVQASIQ